jgi:hypothetical protein
MSFQRRHNGQSVLHRPAPSRREQIAAALG